MNSDKDKPVFPHIKPGSDNFRSEVAKEFGWKGERKVIPSSEGIGKYNIISVEAQMSGVPIYTRKEKDKEDE
jgi:hypothetical protein